MKPFLLGLSSREESGPFIPHFDRFTSLVLSTATASILRRLRKECTLDWRQECGGLKEEFNNIKNSDTSQLTGLLHSLNCVRREKWVNTVDSLKFTHSSQQ